LGSELPQEKLIMSETGRLAAAAALGAAACGVAAYFLGRRRESTEACSPNPRTFALERFFAQYEFSAKYQICNSDVSALSMKELLTLCADDTAMMEAWENLSLGYTESRGLPALLEEIASCYAPDAIAADGVLECVPAEGILLSAQALVLPGDNVIVAWPAYQSLFEIARARGANILKWRCRGGGAERLRFDVRDLAAKVAEAGGRVKLIVINFPHNPTGCQLTRAELDSVVDIARGCGAWLLGDEMYRGLEYDGQPPLPAACEVYEKGISLAGMSKVYALPGLRVGWLVSRSSNGFIAAAAALKDYTTICGAAPSEVLALMALRKRDELLARSKRIVAEGLTHVDAFFSRNPELAHYHRPQAGPICYPCFKGDGLGAADVLAYAESLVAATGVLILPGGTCYDVDDDDDDGPTASTSGAYFRIGLGRLDCQANLGVYEQALREPRFRRCGKA
jgi:aspartate/methionine/tyrosine aminotransferase